MDGVGRLVFYLHPLGMFRYVTTTAPALAATGAVWTELQRNDELLQGNKTMWRIPLGAL